MKNMHSEETIINPIKIIKYVFFLKVFFRSLMAFFADLYLRYSSKDKTLFNLRGERLNLEIIE